ncbi:hypothetical protein SBA7_1940002 [Candidatus Sulfotelmatobacter sp. SbA7]|nr:hypothetical protein SBA7_1940002 [Candidatus Sulfotelmatobacter sp. SbA7]
MPVAQLRISDCWGRLLMKLVPRWGEQAKRVYYGAVFGIRREIQAYARSRMALRRHEVTSK